MRARGAKVTDIAIIIVAADDNVMPQTLSLIHISSSGITVFTTSSFSFLDSKPSIEIEAAKKMASKPEAIIICVYFTTRAAPYLSLIHIYDRHTGSHSMINRLFGLRHHIIIGSYNNNSNIRHFRTTGTHSGKRCV